MRKNIRQPFSPVNCDDVHTASTHTRKIPQPTPLPILYLLSLSRCLSVTLPLPLSCTCIIAVACARPFCSLTVSQKKHAHTWLSFLFLSYRGGHYPWNWCDVWLIWWSLPPSPPLFHLSFLSIDLSVCNSVSSSVSLKHTTNFSCVRANMYKFVRKYKGRFCRYVHRSFADIQRSLLRIYAGCFLTYIRIYIYIHICEFIQKYIYTYTSSRRGLLSTKTFYGHNENKTK